jgi:hypothetical protein
VPVKVGNPPVRPVVVVVVGNCPWTAVSAASRRERVQIQVMVNAIVVSLC